MSWDPPPIRGATPEIRARNRHLRLIGITSPNRQDYRVRRMTCVMVFLDGVKMAEIARQMKVSGQRVRQIIRGFDQQTEPTQAVAEVALTLIAIRDGMRS